MQLVEITFSRALKVWWSYAWRSILLSLIIIVPLQIFAITWIAPHVRAAAAGHGATHPRLREVLEIVAVLWPIAIVGIIILQTIAMRWMLRRARWEDFKLNVSSLEDSPDR